MAGSPPRTIGRPPSADAVSAEWLAEGDRAGNLWKFGEEGLAFDGPAFERTPDSWLVGEGDAAPWMMLSALPAVGEQYLGYRPGGLETMLVEALDATVVVPAGLFAGCLQVVENPADVEDRDIVLYAPGVGRVQESSSAGQMDLVSVGGQ